MNSPDVYTPLERLFLCYSLSNTTSRLSLASFGLVAAQLNGNEFILEEPTYDAARLTPEALQALFLHLVRDQLRREAEGAAEANDGGAGVKGSTHSPGPDGRRVMSPPVVTLESAMRFIVDGGFERLMDRLLADYKQNMHQSIKKDDDRLATLKAEIVELERLEVEDEEKAKAEAAAKEGKQPANGAPAVEEPRQSLAPNGAVTTPVPVPVQAAPKKTPTPVPVPVPPTPPTKRDAAPPTSVFLPPSVASSKPGVAAATGSRPQDARRPPNGAGQPVLQAPVGMPQPIPPQRIQTPIQPPQIPGTPRQDAAAKPKTPIPPPVGAQAPGTLKWERPYQGPQPGPPLVQGRPLQANMPQPPTGPYPPQQMQQPTPWQGQTPGPYAPNLQPFSSTGQPLQQPSGLASPQPAGQLAAPAHAGSVKGPPLPGASPMQPPAGQVVAPGATAQPAQSKPPAQPYTPQPPKALTPVSTRHTQVQTPASQGWRPGPPQPPPLSTGRPPVASQQEGRGPFTPAQRPVFPRHLVAAIANANVATPQTPAGKVGSPLGPQTPVASTPTITRGSGTRWKVEPSPSTPKSAVPSPQYQPLSPVLKPSAAPTTSPPPSGKRQTPKPTQKLDTSTAKQTRGRTSKAVGKSRASSGPVRRSQSVTSQTDELSLDHPDLAPKVKEEVATPKIQEETGDTTADESLPSRRQMITPRNVSTRLKRKRQDSPLEVGLPSVPPTHVLWTRAFPRVSASVLDNIAGHRYANMFASRIRDRDAPGYNGIVLEPQDIKSIRMAISHGHKIAAQVAATMPGGDPNTTSVWLPITDDLVPPKGIINSEQLERELAHMFANAIMYNLDPNRGFGPGFKKRNVGAGGSGEDTLRYDYDENAVVHSTLSMFEEVEKLLGDHRNAQKQQQSGLPPPPLSASASASAAATRVGSVAAGTGAGDDSATAAEDDVDELAGDGADVAGTSGTTSKRRRIGTRT